MFGIRFKKLIKSDRYKNSGYTIQKVNGLYGLKHNYSGGYVDLCSNGYTWNNGSPYCKDCFSYFKSDVIDAFNYRVPIIEPIKSLTEY